MPREMKWSFSGEDYCWLLCLFLFAIFLILAVCTHSMVYDSYAYYDNTYEYTYEVDYAFLEDEIGGHKWDDFRATYKCPPHVNIDHWLSNPSHDGSNGGSGHIGEYSIVEMRNTQSALERVETYVDLQKCFFGLSGTFLFLQILASAFKGVIYFQNNKILKQEQTAYVVWKEQRKKREEAHPKQQLKIEIVRAIAERDLPLPEAQTHATGNENVEVCSPALGGAESALEEVYDARRRRLFALERILKRTQT